MLPYTVDRMGCGQSALTGCPTPDLTHATTANARGAALRLLFMQAHAKCLVLPGLSNDLV